MAITAQALTTACPQCGSAHLRRSRRRRYEHLLAAFSRRRPYRCDDCGRRLWRRPETMGHAHGPEESAVQPADVNLDALDQAQGAEAPKTRP
jgi:predicted RNA-binding Zn-ribbon protein involved in translation (DUF1610 family)